MTAIDKHTIERANANIEATIGKYLPLIKSGSEFKACCPFHDERSPSFTVVPAKGFFHCFGCGESGDAVQFVMQYTGKNFREAVESITGQLPADQVDHSKPRAAVPPVWEPITADNTAPGSAFEHYRLGFPVATYHYRTASGETIGYVCRFEYDGKKETLPLCLAVNRDTGVTEWRWLSFAKPRPLYGLDCMRPDKNILLVEGEKTANAARLIFAGMDVLTWAGGANAVAHADFTPIAGRSVVMWPDADDAGIEAMRRIFEMHGHTFKDCRVVPVSDQLPKGWDLADDAPEGFDPVAYAKASILPAGEYFIEPASSDEIQQPSEPPADFGHPMDIFGRNKPRKIPIDLFPAAIRDYILDQSELIGCDYSVIGMSAIVAAAGCIDDGIKLQPKRNNHQWVESARLWVAAIGDPSSKKTPAIDQATRHLRRIDVQLAGENQRAMADYNKQLEDHKEAKKQDKKTPFDQPKPPNKRLMVGDTTVEALSDIALDNPRGLICMRDELSGWFASMDAYKSGGAKGVNKDRSLWLEAYNGKPMTIDRVTRGSLLVPNWSVSMIGGIQPEMIKSVANSMGHDGLLQRFMVVVADDPRPDVDRVPNMASVNAFSELFDQLYAMQPTEDRVLLSEGAHAVRERFDSVQIRLCNAMRDVSPHLSAWVAKWPGLFSRLLLTYHVIECASQRKFPTNERVSKQTAEMVEHLICGYLFSHSTYFYTEILDANDRQENIRQVGWLILSRGWTQFDKRDLSQRWKKFRNLKDWEVNLLVTYLQNVDWIRPDWTSTDSQNRPRAWHVNPMVHELFKAEKDADIQRRHDYSEVLQEMKDRYARN